MQHIKGSKVGFPVWRNFYERTHVNLKGVHGIEAMSEVSHVDVKVGQDSTFSPSATFQTLPLLYLRTKKFKSEMAIKCNHKVFVFITQNN